MSQKLLDFLFQNKLVNAEQVQKSKAAQGGSSDSPVLCLIQQGAIHEGRLVQYLAQKFSLRVLDLQKVGMSADAIQLLPAQTMQKLQCIPVAVQAGAVTVAIADPTQIPQLDLVKSVTGKEVEIVLVGFSSFASAMKQAVSTASLKAALGSGGGPQSASAPAIVQSKPRTTENEHSGNSGETTSTNIPGKSAIGSGINATSIVDAILIEAARRGASDIHIESLKTRMRARLRIDGTLHEIAEIPAAQREQLISRIKVMSMMDISERRLPQDGRLKMTIEGKETDFRVNTLPTIYGESVVLRMLKSDGLSLSVAKLGMSPAQNEIFARAIHAPHGMVLVTGPTGSGKTTTLYSALSELNQITDKLATVEDPVEYHLDGVNQTQVRKDIDLTFASVLRALLRQDPDVILVGEIRDQETAEIAIQAALTGHLVLSTLHTNDATSTVVRLLNMGIEPLLVTNALTAVVAQRLVRKVCEACKFDQRPSAEELARLQIAPEKAASARFVRGKGCPTCNGAGFKGRLAVYEVLDFTEDLKELILKGENAVALRRYAVSRGMETLRASALARATRGETTIEEAVASTLDH